MSELKWRGAAVTKRVKRASVIGVNDVMSRSVIQAKLNHPGWINRSGLAEGSIDIVEFAKMTRGAIYGRWGSKGVHYFLYLELHHGSALRSAGAKLYPQLGKRIKAALKALPKSR